MKAVVFHQYGPPEVLKVEEVETPTPGESDVLVRVRASTVSSAECEVRRFQFSAWSWLPIRLIFGFFRPRRIIQIPGQELAGDVETVGDKVDAFKPGDKVFGAIMGFGAHAEFACLPASGAIATMPSNLSYDEAATFTTFAMNALHFIRKAELKPGRKILIYGAGGGIGTTAIQLARREGAEVTAVDSADKLDMLRAIGADHVIDYRTEDFTKNGETYDVIFDVVGKSRFSRSMASLAEDGRYIFGNPKTLPMLRGVWANRKKGGKRVLFALAGPSQEDLLYIKSLIEAGALKPVIDRRYRMDEIVEANRYVESGRRKGHVVLQIGE